MRFRFPFHMTGVKARFLAASLLVFGGASVSAHEMVWREDYDYTAGSGDTARILAALDNGDFIAGGQTGSGNTADFLVYRISGANGNIVWTRVMNGLNGDNITDLIADPVTGDTYFCGTCSGFTSATYHQNWYVMKLKGSDGTNSWANPYTYDSGGTNHDAPRRISFVQDGPVKNIVVVGLALGTGGRVVKFDASTGAASWEISTGASGAIFSSVTTDSAGNIYAGGETSNPTANVAVLTKYNVSGTQQWSKNYGPNGGTFNRWNHSALEPVSGDVIVGGLIIGPASQGNNIAIARYTPAGDQSWIRLIDGNNSNDSCSGVIVDGDSAYICASYRPTTTSGLDALIGRIALSDGGITWQKTYTGNTGTTGDSIVNFQIVRSKLYAAGHLTNTTGRNLVLLEANTSNGNSIEYTEFTDRVGPLTQQGNRSLIVTSNGHMIVAGDSNTTGVAEIGRYRPSVAPTVVAPTLVTTPTSASVTHNTATLGGNVSDTGGADVTARGVVYALTSANANPEIGGSSVTVLTETGTFGTGAFTRSASSLTASSSYSFKAYATNSAGTSYSSVGTFTTGAAPAVAPTLVATPTSTSVSYNTATLGGNVSATGGANVTARGVVYALTSANANPEIGGSSVTVLTETGTFGTGAFTRSASSLTASSGYSFKAYATNSAGTSYSNAATFTTAAAPGPPTIYDFENVTNGQTTFVSSSQTWSLTGYMANVISSALGSPLAGAASPGSNGYIESGYLESRGLENVGGIKAPTGYIFKVLSFDVWPSKNSGSEVYGGTTNQLGTVGLNYRVIGKLNNVEVVSADVTDTARSPAQTGTSNGGYWHHLDLSSTAFATTEIDTVEFFLVSQTGDPMDYVAVDNFNYTGLVLASSNPAPTVAVSSLNRVGAELTNATSVSWTLTFGSAVTGVTASHFDLTGTGTSGASIGTPVTSNGGLAWTIPVTTGADGTLILRLANATGLSATISTSLPYAGQSFTVDKTPPNTTITSNPANPTNSTSGTFQFTGTDGSGSGVSSFETKLDSAAFVAETSPKNYLNLTEASHTFQVRAVDAAGNIDPTPASFTWEVDLTPPVVQSVTRLSPAGQNVNVAEVVFRVTYSEAVTLTTPETARYAVVPVNGSTITADVTSVSGSGATRDVTVTITGGAGEFRLRVLN